MKQFKVYLSRNKVYVSLFLLTLLGGYLRLAYIQTLPPMNRDELAIGYNAYSLIHTAKDEHGNGSWPLVFVSFGDYKLPGLIYASMLPTILFGLQPIATRMITVLLGIGLIPITFGVIYTLTKDQKLSVLTSTLLTLAIWHIHASRSAYEPATALTITVGSWWALLKAREKSRYWIIYLGLTALSLMTYNTPLLLSVFVLAVTGFIFWHDYRKRWRGLVVGGVGLIILLVGTIWLFNGINTGKMKTTIFSLHSYDEQMFNDRMGLALRGWPTFLVRTVSNRPAYILKRLIGNYIAVYSPDYLLFNGGNNPWHNLASIGYGEFTWLTIGLFIIGLIVSVHGALQQKSPSRWLLAMLLISPLACAVTIDSPNTNRLMDFHWMVTVMAAVGICWCLQRTRKPYKSLVAWSFIGLLIVNGGKFWIQYRAHYNLHLNLLWQPGFPEAVKATKEWYDHFSGIIVPDSVDLAYIYFAYFTPFDPAELQQQGMWQENGFQQITHYQKYWFGVHDPPKLAEQLTTAMTHNQETGRFLMIEPIDDDKLTTPSVFTAQSPDGKTAYIGHEWIVN